MFMMVFIPSLLMVMSLVLILAGFLEKNSSNSSTVECGFSNTTFSMGFMSVQFMFILIIFVLFDVELILLLSIIIWKTQNLSVYLLVFMVTGLWWEWWFGSISWKM